MDIVPWNWDGSLDGRYSWAMWNRYQEKWCAHLVMIHDGRLTLCVATKKEFKVRIGLGLPYKLNHLCLNVWRWYGYCLHRRKSLDIRMAISFDSYLDKDRLRCLISNLRMGAVLMSVDNSNTIVRAVRAARHSYIIEVWFTFTTNNDYLTTRGAPYNQPILM